MMGTDVYPHSAIVSAEQAIAYLGSDEVIALRIRGRPRVENFERIRHRPGPYAADILSINVVEVIYDMRDTSGVSRNRVVTDRLFLRPEDADAVRREFPECCEPVMP